MTAAPAQENSDDAGNASEAKLPDEADVQSGGLVADFFDYLKHNKKWWLLPIVILLVLFGVFLVFAQSSPLAPLLYPLF